MKRGFANLTLEDVMEMVGRKTFTVWQIDAPPRPPTDILVAVLDRYKAFDTVYTEAAKLLLIDALLAEIVPVHPGLKVWKSMPLESDTLTGFADYLIAPDYAYLSMPLLCAVEAKRDDFAQGRTQCVAEMLACQWNNRQKAHETDVFGIVSNGQVWQFYKLAQSGEVFETAEYVMNDLPRLLGILAYVCAECALRVP